MRLRQAELTILIWGSKGGEIRQNGHLVQILLESVIPTKSHHMRIQWWLRDYEWMNSFWKPHSK
jgi:hypothetical protein